MSCVHLVDIRNVTKRTAGWNGKIATWFNDTIQLTWTLSLQVFESILVGVVFLVFECLSTREGGRLFCFENSRSDWRSSNRLNELPGWNHVAVSAIDGNTDTRRQRAVAVRFWHFSYRSIMLMHIVSHYETRLMYTLVYLERLKFHSNSMQQLLNKNGRTILSLLSLNQQMIIY